jgi:adenylate cyclase
VLARTPGLDVAARTSSFAFKGQTKEIPEIARELNVRMVLEGSVRQQDDNVRITVQLIDAESGFHLWSETYDRELKNIFTIQDDIAKAIGDELRIQVGGVRETAAAAAEAVNPEAHDLYLRGLALWQSRTVQGLLDAITTLEKATAVDPGFAPAWAWLGLAYVVTPDYTERISHDEGFRRGRDAAERALALDPTLPDPYVVLGNIAFMQGNTDTGLALMRRAVAISPSFAMAHQWLGTSLATARDLQEGLAALRRASELDPRSPAVANNYGWFLLAAGRNAEAIAACKAVLDAAPDTPLCLEIDALARLFEDGPRAARASIQHWARLVTNGTGHGSRTCSRPWRAPPIGGQWLAGSRTFPFTPCGPAPRRTPSRSATSMHS